MSRQIITLTNTGYAIGAIVNVTIGNKKVLMKLTKITDEGESIFDEVTTVENMYKNIMQNIAKEMFKPTAKQLEIQAWNKEVELNRVTKAYTK